MIFYERKKLPRVWAGKNKRPAVVFHDGVFETEDQELIDLLVKAGYPHEKEPVQEPEPAPIFDFSEEEEWDKVEEEDDESIQTD
jgi:hypothetical protein